MTDTETKEKKDVVPSQYRERYKATGGTNGDFIAVALQKMAKESVDALNTIKAENNIEADRWSTFNTGMQRMNLANVLRGRYLKGETISILGKQYNAKHQAEDFNGTVTNDDKTLERLAGVLELAPGERTTAALRKLFFPPAPTGKTAEQRAAEKVERDAAKAKEKADKADAAAKAKADKAAAAAKVKEDKAAEKAEAKRVKDEAAAKAKADKAEQKRIADENKVKIAQEAAALKADAAE